MHIYTLCYAKYYKMKVYLTRFNLIYNIKEFKQTSDL